MQQWREAGGSAAARPAGGGRMQPDIDAGLRQPEQILASPAVRQTLDLSRPVALMLVAILHFLPDAEDPARLSGRSHPSCCQPVA
jgi:S-adenosyl methyltransferase